MRLLAFMESLGHAWKSTVSPHHACPHFYYYSQNKQQEQFHIKLPFCMMWNELESLRVAHQLIFTSIWVQNKGQTRSTCTLLCGLTSPSCRQEKQPGSNEGMDFWSCVQIGVEMGMCAILSPSSLRSHCLCQCFLLPASMRLNLQSFSFCQTLKLKCAEVYITSKYIHNHW